MTRKQGDQYDKCLSKKWLEVEVGRGTKTLMNVAGVDRRAEGHYVTPPEVASFLARELLDLNPTGMSVLDPCTGTGTLLKPFFERGIKSDGIDVLDWRRNEFDNFELGDFLSIVRPELEGKLGSQRVGSYDFIVMNPPYNCHESDYVRKNKIWLNDVFTETGVANIYAMFIASVVRAAKPGAVIGIIALDSFLTARLHEPLRRLILRECRINLVALCSTDLFLSQGADVRTCIIILTKGPQSDSVPRVMNRPTSSTELFLRLESGVFETSSISKLILQDKRDRAEFVIGAPAELRMMFEGRRLGETFACVTGVSTGNDGKYFSTAPGREFNTPFYKNPASKRFWMEPDCYIIDHFEDESKRVSNFIVRNRSIALSSGISCSSMGVPFGAVYRPSGTAFGVNPNIVCDNDDAWWLLGFLNSSLATYLVRGMLLRTNMVTSGYVSRLPLPEISNRGMSLLTEIAREGYMDRVDTEGANILRKRIDEVLNSDLALTEHTIQEINDFNDELVLRV